MKDATKIVLLILLVLIADQVLKVYIKTNFAYGDGFDMLGLPWAKIHFVENPGMAFGIEFGGEYGKLALSLFRVVMVGLLGYYLVYLHRHQTRFGIILCFALILAGAIGNIIDSAFYGMIFSASPYHSDEIAQLVPWGQGYAGFLHGRVVDMFHFPLLRGTFPDWMPVWGGEPFEFFRPVFNIADTAISVGVISLLVFHRDFFTNPPGETPDRQEESDYISSETEVHTPGNSDLPSISG